MWFSATPLVLALVFASSLFTASRSQILSDDEAAMPPEEICRITCSQSRPKPVCGSDGRTYFSECELKRQVQCEGNRIHKTHNGKCAEESKCRKDRLRAQETQRPMPAAFIPECRVDGSYAEVQCHTPTGYCWCVNESGMPVQGSSVTNKRPVCNRKNGKQNSKRTTPRRRKDRRGCSHVERSNFNEDLVKIFLSEYTRLPSSTPATNEQTEHVDREDSSSTEQGATSLWNRQITTLTARVRPTDTNIQTGEDDVADCPSDRQTALDDLRHTDGKVFVPECSPDGKYSKLQCFKPTSHCWCVEPETGKTIAGTTLIDAKPDCNKSFRLNKPIKGCNTDRKKQQFLTELVDSFVKEMLTLNHSALEQKTDISTNTQEMQEKAAVQKLRQLDANNNQVIDKKEWKDFKNEIKKRKVMRKCGRNFLKYCDDDNNRKVTEDEWISCLGLRDVKIINPSTRRTGKNPLEILLTK